MFGPGELTQPVCRRVELVEINSVRCVIGRSGGDHEVLDDEGVELVSLFSASDLK